jgi:hypothetical protein
MAKTTIVFNYFLLKITDDRRKKPHLPAGRQVLAQMKNANEDICDNLQ